MLCSREEARLLRAEEEEGEEEGEEEEVLEEEQGGGCRALPEGSSSGSSASRAPTSSVALLAAAAAQPGPPAALPLPARAAPALWQALLEHMGQAAAEPLLLLPLQPQPTETAQGLPSSSRAEAAGGSSGPAESA